MQSLRAIALLLGTLFFLAVAKAQMVTIRKMGDKTIACVHTGLVSDRRDCGFRADWYAYVFVGSISAVTAADNDEERLELHPEEIFHGSPPSSLTVFTSQALCLPKLAVGDRWLFYLRKVNDKPIVLDYFANDSIPVANASEQIKTLRRLEMIGDRGIVRGYVRQGQGTRWKPIDRARVVAHGTTGKLQFITSTDADGHYEFEPLPAGTYKITMHPIGSFRPEAVSVDVSRGTCWEVMLSGGWSASRN
jgi:carboxypeptidase family protein